jgi:CheY-like chemotaxis protein
VSSNLPGRVWGQSQGVELFERKRRGQRRHALPVSAKLSQFQDQAVPVHAQGNTAMIRVDYSSCVVSSLLLPPRVMSQFLSRATERSSQHSPSNETSRREFNDRRNLLVVDDVADIRELLSVMLSYAGYAVVTASSALAALEAARQRHFDVVISDVGMPEMSGYQLAEALRLLPGYEAVPMVAVTGYSMFNDRELSLNAGFNAHVAKPIDPQALLALIEKL